MRFRKKPMEIEAWKWNGVQELADSGAPDWLLEACREKRVRVFNRIELGGGDDRCMEIGTAEGTMRAKPGDWIIKGVKGELYPCKPDIFEQTYEKAET